VRRRSVGPFLMIRLLPPESSEFDFPRLVGQVLGGTNGRFAASSLNQRVDRRQEALPNLPTPKGCGFRVAEDDVGIVVGGVEGHSLHPLTSAASCGTSGAAFASVLQAP